MEVFEVMKRATLLWWRGRKLQHLLVEWSWISTLIILRRFLVSVYEAFMVISFGLPFYLVFRKGKVWIHTLGHTQESSPETGISPHTSVSNLKHSWPRECSCLAGWRSNVFTCAVSPLMKYWRVGSHAPFQEVKSRSGCQRNATLSVIMGQSHVFFFFFIPRRAYNDAL